MSNAKPIIYHSVHPLNATSTRSASHREVRTSVISVMNMVILAACAVICVWDQYFHYLDGKEVSELLLSQVWIGRSANAFAFLVKSLMVFAVSSAFYQVLWRTLSDSTMQICTVDKSFGVLGNPWSLVNLDVLRQAKLAMLIASMIWCLPIAGILSPATLTIDFAINTRRRTISIRVPDLSIEQGMFTVQTDHNGVSQYYGGSDQLSQTVYAPLINGKITTFASPCGANCSYTTMFEAPVWSCRKLTSEDDLAVLDTDGPNFYVGQGNWYVYDCLRITNTSATPSLIQTYQGLYGNDTITDYSLRFDVPISVNTSERSPYGSYANPSGAPNMAGILCEFDLATYNVSMEWTDSLLEIKTELESRQNLYEEPLQLVWPPLKGSTDPVFSAYNYTRLNSHAFLRTLNNFFEGSIKYKQGGLSTNKTLFGLTTIPLTYPHTVDDYVNSTTITQDLESLMHNATLSLLAPGALLNVTTQEVVALSYNYEAIYKYHRLSFWSIHIIAMFVSLSCCCAGLVAYKRAGQARDGSFFQILASSQHPSIAALFYGQRFDSKGIKKQNVTLDQQSFVLA